jgi:hypothetical protein
LNSTPSRATRSKFGVFTQVLPVSREHPHRPQHLATQGGGVAWRHVP